MDIIFQSGEFNYQPSSVNAWLIELFRALVTVSMFFVGFYWNSWKEKKKQGVEIELRTYESMIRLVRTLTKCNNVLHLPTISTAEYASHLCQLFIILFIRMLI